MTVIKVPASVFKAGRTGDSDIEDWYDEPATKAPHGMEASTDFLDALERCQHEMALVEECNRQFARTFVVMRDMLIDLPPGADRDMRMAELVEKAYALVLLRGLDK